MAENKDCFGITKPLMAQADTDTRFYCTIEWGHDEDGHPDIHDRYKADNSFVMAMTGHQDMLGEHLDDGQSRIPWQAGTPWMDYATGSWNIFPIITGLLSIPVSEKSEIDSNPLKKLRENKVNTVSFETFDEITKKIVYNADEFLIMPIQLDDTDISEDV